MDNTMDMVTLRNEIPGLIETIGSALRNESITVARAQKSMMAMIQIITEIEECGDDIETLVGLLYLLMHRPGTDRDIADDIEYVIELINF